jgi:hypothetical protein
MQQEEGITVLLLICLLTICYFSPITTPTQLESHVFRTVHI